MSENNTYLFLTTARCQLLNKLLEGVPPKQRDATYHDLVKDVHKINGIWAQLIAKRPKPVSEKTGIKTNK